MCRIFAYIGELNNGDFTNSLEKFSRLSKEGCVPCGVESGHLDGWGFHAMTEKDEVYFRSIDLVSEEKISLVASPVVGSRGQVVAHLRKASVGKKYICNTHPFLRSGISFCHNGSVFASPDSDFVKDRYLREGHTDTETLFLRILDRVEGQKGDASLFNLKSALLSELEEIKSTFLWTSLTCILKSSNGLVLNYLWNESHPDALKEGFDGYYTFFIGRKDKEIILCSEKLDVEGFEWEQLKNDTTLLFEI